MGKKSDKSAKEKPITQSLEEVSHKTPEPYQCVGNIVTDFTELCREKNLGFSIPIVVQNKRGLSPMGFSVDTTINLQTAKKSIKDDKKPQSVPHQIDPELLPHEDKEIINAIGFKPRSFVIKPSFSALKPSICVESDNVEKVDNVTELSIRRWNVDLKILEILETCFTKVTKLTTITLWRVGLTSATISKLAEVLTTCETIKFLTIENNEEAEEENYYELMKSDSNLTKLHLRYCNITPKGAKAIAEELGTLTYTGNNKLLILDLSGCRLGDFGALYLAKALRINRTLLSLSLNNCDIGDEASQELAKTVSRYILNEEEILCRRKLLSERNFFEASKSVSSFSRASISSSNISPPISRRGDSKDRPVSVRSSSKDDKSKKEKVIASKGKKDIKEEKHEKTITNRKKEDKTASTKKVSNAIVDLTKTAKPKGGRSAKQSKSLNQADSMSDATSENLDALHPLLHKVEAIEPGKLLIPGNFILLMLNLSRNRITETGLRDFSMAVSYQTTQMSMAKVNGTGLLRLALQGNRFDESNETYQKFQQILANRDHKSKSPNLEMD